MMRIPIRPAVVAAALALAAVPAAAQTLPGAFTTPVGEFEYRWQVRVYPDGRVERTPAGGYLRLHENGRYAHSRQEEGTAWSRSSGTFSQGGNLLYVTTLEDPASMASHTDTFVVRHPGDRLYLWRNLHDEGFVEYELAPPGAPAERTPGPGLIPGLYGYVAEMRYYEGGAGTLPYAQRAFATAFPSATTRYVWVQLQIEYPTALDAGEYPVTCRILGGTGAVMHEHTSAVRVTRGSGARYFTYGWGREAPGLIPPDTYRVHCDVAGEKMPLEGTFQVT
jgi:hypothetical protein